MCDNFLLLYHKFNVIDVLQHLDKEKYFSININFIELLESDPKLANQLLSDPETTLKSWDQAIFNVQGKLLHENGKTKCTIKNNVTCRIYSLPPWSHISFTTFPGQAHTGKFIQISGTVTRISAKKLLEYQRQYLCTKCKYPIIVAAQFDKMNIIKAPKRCTNPEGCGSKHIITFGELDPYNCKDYQEIKLQEDLSKPGIGSTPNHMIVILEDDLVDTCKPGENVTICGILERRWSEFSKGEEMKIDIALKANHVQVNNNTGTAVQISDEIRESFKDFWEKYKTEPLIGRNVIIRSFAPELYGLHLVKLAIAMVLAGGTHNAQDSSSSTGIQTRAESHILLVGDPGTGKSEMLRFASKIVRRSVLTTGVGSTAAGLTVTAVMDKGQWQLEAGALVMSDGGICCIDEFNSMKEHDRTSIHEAMEQQTISVAKGGIVCKLKTRCSILAACNPKGNIDLSKPLCMNVAMSSPLLSRFDLIVLIRDTVNSENDKKLAQNFGVKNDEHSWNLEKLQAYYAFIKDFHPKLSDDAETILSTYYQLQRKLDTRNKSRTTVRLLESLIRLSQGHAKLMFHLEVQVMDTIFAVILVDAALDYDSSLLGLKVSNNSFCDNPETTYRELGASVLRKLNLEHIWKRELNDNQVNVYANDSDNNLFESLVPHCLEETSNLNPQVLSTPPVKSQELATTHTEKLLDIDPSTSNVCSKDKFNNVSNKNQYANYSQNVPKSKTSFPKFASRYDYLNENNFDLDKPVEFTKIKSQCNLNNSANLKNISQSNLQGLINKHTENAKESDSNSFKSVDKTSKLNPQVLSTHQVDAQGFATTNTERLLDIGPSTSNVCQKVTKTKSSFPKFASRFDYLHENDFNLDKPVEFTKIKRQCNVNNSVNQKNIPSTNAQGLINTHTEKDLDISPQHICKNALDRKQFTSFSQNIPKTKTSFPKFSSRFDWLNGHDFDLDKPLSISKVKTQCNGKNVKSIPQILTNKQTDLNVNIDASRSTQYSQDIFNNDPQVLTSTQINLNVNNGASTSAQCSQFASNSQKTSKNKFANLNCLNDDNFDFDKRPSFRLQNMEEIKCQNKVKNSESKEVSEKIFEQENSQKYNVSQNSESGYSSINITTTDTNNSSLIKSKHNSNVSQLSQIKKLNLLSQIGSQLDLDDLDKPSNYRSEILSQMKHRKKIETPKKRHSAETNCFDVNSASDKGTSLNNESLDLEVVGNSENNTLINQNFLNNDNQKNNLYRTEKLETDELDFDKPFNTLQKLKTKTGIRTTKIPFKNLTKFDHTFEEDDYSQNIISQIKNKANLERNLTQENEDLLKQQRNESARQVSKMLENYKAKQKFQNKTKMSDKTNNKISNRVSSPERVLHCEDFSKKKKLLKNDGPPKKSSINKDNVLASCEKKENVKSNAEVMKKTKDTDNISLQSKKKTQSKKSTFDLIKCFEFDSSESKTETYCDMDTTLSSTQNKGKKSIKEKNINKDNKKRTSSDENLKLDKATKVRKLDKRNSSKNEVDDADELAVLKNIPSVNDDFLKFNLDFDDTEFNF